MRFLIVDNDAKYGAWLRHHVGVTLPEAEVQVLDAEAFERMRISLTRRDYALVIVCAAFGEDPDSPDSEGLGWLRKLKEQPGLPPLIAIAADGNELTAVRALRLGASDYLPKRLLTPSRLATAIRIALRAQRRGRDARGSRAASRPATDSTITAPTLGAASSAEEPPRLAIPRYTILQTIGESDKAVVYLARSLDLERNVALKVSRKRQDGDTETRQLFAREYAAIAALNHPDVVDIYDYGVHGGHEYLAMEYFPCGDLKARLQHPISEEESLDFLRRIARALRVVHAAGLVHRDLKPPNVMLRETGDVVLIDFGLARNLQDTTGSTRTGTLRGSPYYMSPEQTEGRTLDRRTDIYSLGVIFFEMLTGTRPYSGSTAIEVLQQHVHAPVPKLPPALAHHQQLLEGLMAKNRDQRVASAEELLIALGEPPSAAPIAEAV